MDDSTLKNRRRFLEGVGIGGGMLLAGCSDRLDLGGGQDPAQTSDGGVAAIAAVDRQAMQQEQAEIQAEIQSGNMTQAEAQQAVADLQEKYVGEALDSLGSTVEETEGVSAGQRYESLAAVTLEGEADAILGLLQTEDVRALVSVADVEAQAGTPEGEG